MEREGWLALAEHAANLRARSLADLFADDPERSSALCFEAAGLYVDLSKNIVDARAIELLAALARECGLAERIEAMFRGERVNRSEDRPALHVALRADRATRIEVDGRDVVGDVHAVLDRMSRIAEDVRSGAWRGATGRPIRNIVNIGIGGSDLGPRMACDALGPWIEPGLRLRFAANIDPADLARALGDQEPAETLFTVCSKTFSTLETLTNARAARAWLEDALGPDCLKRHMICVSADREAVRASGFPVDGELRFWDWVGGRYSLCSAVGLSLMIAVGPERFRELLAGAREVDEHFRSEPFERNLPALLGLLSVWYGGFFERRGHALLPYAARLARFPAWLQQLEMESNGKRVRADGRPVDASTSTIVFGEPGSDAQHAFFQLLHQGTEFVSCDFIGFARNAESTPEPGTGDGARAHDWLVANLIAQGQAMAFGRSPATLLEQGVPKAVAAQRDFPGNRPSTTILARQLDARTLGRLVALYEHRTLVEATIWGINPFDQWGVELGKVAARRIAAELGAGASPGGAPVLDASSAALLARYRQWRGEDPEP